MSTKNPDRGFKQLVGLTIRSVDTRAINEVVLVDTEGNYFGIAADVNGFGITAPYLTRLELNEYGVPKQPRSSTKGKHPLIKS